MTAPKASTELKAKWTDKYVKADDSIPELKRFRGITGRVVTVNENGHALVDFKDGAWYDVDPARLTIVEKPPEPPPAAGKHKKAEE